MPNREGRGSVIPKVVVLFRRLGPYHVARIAAAVRWGSTRGADVLAVEVARTDCTYGWSPIADPLPFRRLSLSEGDYETLSRREIGRRVWSALDAERPGAVAIPGWAAPEALAALRWCRRRGVVAVLMTESARTDFRRWPWREAWKKRRVRCFDAALAGGQAHAEYARELGIPAERIFLGYDAVDNEHFYQGAEEARREASTLRQELRLPQQYWLCVCRLVSKKNVAGLLEGFAEYARRVGPSAWDLVLCGEGPLRGSLQRLALRLGIASQVRFAGFVTYQHMPAYYGLAETFVLASTVEQWGLVVNEAMAAGLPVLVSCRCGAAELVEHGVHGATFDPFDSSAIATALEGIFRLSKEARRAMGEACRRRIAPWGPQRFAEGLWAAVEAGSAAREGGQ